jgi:hypothetical protein
MKETSRTIKHEMICRNWKYRILLALVIVLGLYFVLVIFCGGFSLSGCF